MGCLRTSKNVGLIGTSFVTGIKVPFGTEQRLEILFCGSGGSKEIAGMNPISLMPVLTFWNRWLWQNSKKRSSKFSAWPLSKTSAPLLRVLIYKLMRL